ncbi:MAG: efflux RND transporter periplasmic adaptor subunit [Oscillospiraceae bacterium]|nr:efflux RND transporter periplasmic adaptor subunit [Oscillospiraceae bacterium]
MKRYILLVVICFSLIIGINKIPYIIKNNIKSVNITKGSNIKHLETLVVSGTINEQSKKDISIPIPVVVEKIFFNIGDKINIGQTIATIDQEKTFEQILNSIDILSKNIPEETFATFSSYISKIELIKNFIPENIVATASGNITSLNIIENSISDANKSIATISNTDKLIANISIPEDLVSYVKEGQKVILEGDGFKGISYTGHISDISSFAKKELSGLSQSTSVKASINIDNIDEHLKPGFSTKVEIYLDETPQYMVTLPYELIQQDKDNNEFILAIEKNKVTKKYIKTGEEMSQSVEIIEGIDLNTTIISSLDDIKEGDMVEIKNIKGD